MHVIPHERAPGCVDTIFLLDSPELGVTDQIQVDIHRHSCEETFGKEREDLVDDDCCGDVNAAPSCHQIIDSIEGESDCKPHRHTLLLVVTVGSQLNALFLAEQGAATAALKCDRLRVTRKVQGRDICEAGHSEPKLPRAHRLLRYDEKASYEAKIECDDDEPIELC